MREDGRDDAQLDEHASRASALLAARASGVKAGASPRPGRSQPQPESQPQPQSRQEYASSAGEFVKRNFVYIAGVAAVALVVALGVVILGALGQGSSDIEKDSEESAAYASPYDWTKLDRADGRYRYIVDGQVKSRLGIDVSENQHEIDWDAVASDGIDFAMIRVGYRGATEGDIYLDECYWANMDGARSAGLDVGAYFFSQARTVDEAVEEADYVLEQLGGTKLEYPIAFDSEVVVLNLETSRTTGLGADEMTAIAEAFCKRVEDAGYESVIYGNSADLSRYRYGNLEQNSIWWAEYGTPVPAANIDIDFWQYSNSGTVAGIPYAVDMNIDLRHVL